jgi:hypothetical protein
VNKKKQKNFDRLFFGCPAFANVAVTTKPQVFKVFVVLFVHKKNIPSPCLEYNVLPTQKGRPHRSGPFIAP